MTKGAARRVECTIDASVSKKHKTKQHVKYDQLCHEQRQAEAACVQETGARKRSEVCEQGRKESAAHEREGKRLVTCETSTWKRGERRAMHEASTRQSSSGTKYVMACIDAMRKQDC